MQQTLPENIFRLKQTIEASVSPFHCILESSRQLKEAGFEELELGKRWTLAPGGSYFVNCYDSTLAAFTIGNELTGDTSNPPLLRLACAHTDWPCFKLKPSPEVISGRYARLNVEVYGGPIFSTWMDRPLSMAGKVCLAGDSPFCPDTRFVDFKRPMLTIPNLAIHMNREMNNGVALNAQIDMLPLLGVLEEAWNKEHYFLTLLAKELNVDASQILDYEIYLYNLDPGTGIGMEQELYSSPRLDNITSVQACLSGIIKGKRKDGINMIALYDNEEIGSATKQGASSDLTSRITEKLYLALGYDKEDYLNALFQGFLLSIDVAHAIHPNRGEKCDIKNQILLNDGVAVKMAASQAYATDSACVGVIESLCKAQNIPYKKFSNRSDIKGGSTLGSISSCRLTMKAVDIGIPMLAMHSAREVMGIHDQDALCALVQAFLSTSK